MGKPKPSRVFPAGHHHGHGYGHRVTCGCGSAAFIATATGSAGGLPVTAVMKRLQGRGWEVRRGGRDVKCDECLKPKPKPAAIAKPVPAAAPIKTTAPQLAQQPEGGTTTVTTKPTREQKREIMDVLHSHYEGDGWAGDWSDAKAAKHLNMAPAWVRDIRVEFFGDADVNEAQRAADRARAQAVADLRRDLKAAQLKLDDGLAAIATAEREFSALAGRITSLETGK